MKLTPKEFYDGLHKKFKDNFYMARDADGEWFLYRNKPVEDFENSCWVCGVSDKAYPIPVELEDNSKWDESLHYKGFPYTEEVLESEREQGRKLEHLEAKILDTIQTKYDSLFEIVKYNAKVNFEDLKNMQGQIKLTDKCVVEIVGGLDERISNFNSLYMDLLNQFKKELQDLK